MKKKILAILLSFVFAFTMFGLTGCGGSEEAAEPAEEGGESGYGEVYDAFAGAVDMDFVKDFNQKISEFGDDEIIGMRSAASPAETETAEYVKATMEDIGLQNVTMDDATVDGWTFNGASITFKNAKGKEVTANLGGYQTTIQADNEEVELVYVGRGTEADYNGIDVKGKLVLFEINQEEDWWINYPAVQAKNKGALCAIAMREMVDMGDDTGDRIGVQDICGPADAPALAISNKDCKALKRAIKKYGDGSIEASIKVKFNADSKVTENATSHNVWGEIPGKTPETIFVFSHMDGYFHSAYDDAQGCGISMGIAKALIDSDYVPDKTIRFCFHGAEEWGREGSEYDWSVGAYEEIVNNHPDWVDGGFCIVNNDGGYTVEGAEYKGINCAPELKKFVKSSVGEMNKAGKFEWSYNPPSTGTEDFMWARKGIPAIVCADGDATNYDDRAYHSSYDSWEYTPLDEEGYQELVNTFGKLVIDLDACNVRPMNFTARIKEFENSLSEDAGDQFDETLAKAYDAADAFSAKIDEVEKSGDKDAAVELNKEIQEVYLAFEDSLVGLDFMDVNCEDRNLMYQENLECINGAIKALKKGNIQEAYDDWISGIDWAWYDMMFDEETCDYMENQLFEKRDDTWGEGMIEFPHADTRALVDSLKLKYDDENEDVSEEIEMLKTLKAEQTNYLNEIYASELEGLDKAAELMQKYAK
ncbi:MAG: M20/M25/M40 family metallo-hydrolase [Clostridia bacterium]|nr:M20/M25/M40 family metallo-hydrolase [Clostridia bacterium]